MSAQTIDSKLLKKLIETPETAIEHLNLVYVTDTQLSISRKKKKDDFIYFSSNGPLTQQEELERIKNLVIPPAWQEVRISHLANGHLQAVGKDIKRRKQYRYHALWTKIRNQTKFYRMAAFGDALPQIRKRVDADLEKKGWPKNRVLALVVKLMEETHIRIGNEQYAKRNKSYGLTTLRKRHIDIYKDNIKFHFIGKKGKEHNITLRNKKLIRLVSRCEEIPGWELFKFYDGDGVRHDVTSELVNEYIQNISGHSFTAKDFRTWAASVVFFDTLMDIGVAKKEKQRHKNILTAFDAAAAALGNTRNVCRKYYVHPFLVASYEDGSIAKSFKKSDVYESDVHFSASEKAIREKIKNYNPVVEI